MFEPAACSRLRVMAVPTVGCDALLELKALLRTAQRPRDSGDVLQAQHRSLLAAGGADAMASEPTATLATDTVSSPTLASVVSDVATRDPRKTIRLLARLLRLHVDRVIASGQAQEARDE